MSSYCVNDVLIELKSLTLLLDDDDDEESESDRGREDDRVRGSHLPPLIRPRKTTKRWANEDEEPNQEEDEEQEEEEEEERVLLSLTFILFVLNFLSPRSMT
ncbi:hypothetical protein RUM43_007206 [Polyplax serrata]|uniref:Uncharacterized protein n=1 Tax=Polyplax serrata TaxID=468196 RepID=A0AAN8PCA0_POLSC